MENKTEIKVELIEWRNKRKELEIRNAKAAAYSAKRKAKIAHKRKLTMSVAGIAIIILPIILL